MSAMQDIIALVKQFVSRVQCHFSLYQRVLRFLLDQLCEALGQDWRDVPQKVLPSLLALRNRLHYGCRGGERGKGKGRMKHTIGKWKGFSGWLIVIANYDNIEGNIGTKSTTCSVYRIDSETQFL